MNSFLQTFQKDESKDNPWSCWVIELDKDFLNLLTYDGTTTSKKLPILHHRLWIRSLGGKSKK
jgi:hypothetical protein